ncbi:Ubiquitin carboxyl-terminal hydrolase family protein [Cryptosporidium felis]|nr:Ubiquitin carboxyl-terminal hydrolase family protein [Cryptosporidium felis]
MSQRGVLRDGMDLNKLGLRSGAKIVLVGTPEGGELKVPTEKTIFFEDLTSDERAKILQEKQIDPLPVGLENLGNTCYLNSIIHMLRSIPSFLQILRRSQLNSTNRNELAPTNSIKFINSFRELMDKMDGSIESVSPVECVGFFRRQFPQYNTTSGVGPLAIYQQQDAEEVLGSLLTLFKSELNGKDDEDQTIGDIFRFRMRTKFKNTAVECDEEVKMEEHYKLLCHMGTQLDPVDFLTQGIKVSMDETVEKKSPDTGVDSIYKKTSEIDSLPPYLLVHLVRFEWKKSSEIARTEATRAKVCRKIEFSKNLDIYEFCSEELRKILNIGRDLSEKMKNQPKECKEQNIDSGLFTDFPTGEYELECIITHQGRTADSGHYVAWRYSESDREYIIKFDDEKVSKMKAKDTDLSGGRSDYHIAVILLYKKKIIKASEEEMNTLMS